MEGSAIYVASVPHFEHDHSLRAIFDQVHNPVVTLPQSILILPRQLLAPEWSRLIGQALDALHDALPVFFRYRLELLGRRLLDQEPIGGHAASSP